MSAPCTCTVSPGCNADAATHVAKLVDFLRRCEQASGVLPVTSKNDQYAASVLEILRRHGVDPDEQWVPFMLGMVAGFEAASARMPEPYHALLNAACARAAASLAYALGKRIPPGSVATDP